MGNWSWFGVRGLRLSNSVVLRLLQSGVGGRTAPSHERNPLMVSGLGLGRCHARHLRQLPAARRVPLTSSMRDPDQLRPLPSKTAASTPDKDSRARGCPPSYPCISPTCHPPLLSSARPSEPATHPALACSGFVSTVLSSILPRQTPALLILPASVHERGHVIARKSIAPWVGRNLGFCPAGSPKGPLLHPPEDPTRSRASAHGRGLHLSTCKPPRARRLGCPPVCNFFILSYQSAPLTHLPDPSRCQERELRMGLPGCAQYRCRVL